MCQLKLNRTMTFPNGENRIYSQHNLKSFNKQILLASGANMLFNRLGRRILVTTNSQQQNCRQFFKFGGR